MLARHCCVASTEQLPRTYVFEDVRKMPVYRAIAQDFVEEFTRNDAFEVTLRIILIATAATTSRVSEYKFVTAPAIGNSKTDFRKLGNVRADKPNVNLQSCIYTNIRPMLRD